MSPEHSYNPFDNPSFRQEMKEVLNESIGPIKEEVKAHGEWIAQQKGAGRVVHVLWTGFVSAATAVTVRLLGK